MQVNTDSVALLTKQVLKSEIDALKTRLDTPGAGPDDPRWLGDMSQMKNAVYVLEKRIEELEGASE